MIHAGGMDYLDAYYGDNEVLRMYIGDFLMWAGYVNIGYALDNVSASTGGTALIGDTFTCVLSGIGSNKVQENSVIVTMGGVDITSTAYDHSTKTIAISSVTGEISITAVGRPYDAEVEYLESNGDGGRAYIDTGIKTSNNVTFDVKASTTTTLNCFIIGGRTAYNNKQLSVTLDFSSGNINWGYGNSTVTWGTTMTATDYNASNTATSRILVINNHSITANSATFSNDYNLFLFAMNNGGTMSAGNTSAVVRIKSAKIYSSGTLVRDYIPVRDNGVGYLYDKVSGQFYGNANSSGAFTYGNDI